MGDSTPDAFTKTNTINLREFTLFLRECGFVKSEEDHRREQKHAAAVDARGAAAVAARDKKKEATDKRLREAQGIKTFYRAEFTVKEAFASFSNANLDSDWESTSFYTLDTEMVLMEFVEGLARLALFRLRKANAEEEEFPRYLDTFLSDCEARFPHWNKYARLLDETKGRNSRMDQLS